MHLGHKGKEGCDSCVSERGHHLLFMARPTPDGIPVKSVRRFTLRSDKAVHSSALSLPSLANSWLSTSAKKITAGSTNRQLLLRCLRPVVHFQYDQTPQSRRPRNSFPPWSLALRNESE